MPHFSKIILIGRPASGKSELIHFLKNLPEAVREREFHIGTITELDDFLWLWNKFVEDDIWEQAGYPRLFSKKSENAYVTTEGSVLDFCFAKFNKSIQTQPTTGTVFVEFARGAGDGGYRHALNRLSDEVLQDAAILYIQTSYEEACRRNEARYQEKLKHSVLAHKVPTEDMKRFGQSTDWPQLTQEQPSGYLPIRKLKIPFVTMNNEPEYKTTETNLLAKRYKEALGELMKLYENRREAKCA